MSVSLVFKVLWFIGGLAMTVLAVLLGGVGFPPLERWIRRPIRHPDGSVTVEGGVHRLSTPSDPGKRLFGFVTVSTTEIVLSIDREAKFGRLSIPLAGTEIEVLDRADKHSPAEVMVTTSKGGRYRLRFHPEHVEILTLLKANLPLAP